MITELQLLIDRDLLKAKRKAFKSFIARRQEGISTCIIFGTCIGLEVYAIVAFIRYAINGMS